MAKDRPSEVLGGLPRSRPHRRSDKRAARPAAPDADGPQRAATPARPAAKQSRAKRPQATRSTAKPRPAAQKPERKAPRLRQPAQPRGAPPPRKKAPPPAPAKRGDVVSTAVQAAAELAEIGLSLSARAVRGAVSRLPRP